MNWFIRTHFGWYSHQDGSLSVRLSQEAYTQNIVETCRLANINFNPMASPYLSECPTDATQSTTIDEEDQVFLQ